MGRGDRVSQGPIEVLVRAVAESSAHAQCLYDGGSIGGERVVHVPGQGGAKIYSPRVDQVQHLGGEGCSW